MGLARNVANTIGCQAGIRFKGISPCHLAADNYVTTMKHAALSEQQFPDHSVLADFECEDLVPMAVVGVQRGKLERTSPII
jgi:hypothetical protein